MDYTVRTDMAISEWTKGALTERKLIMGEQLTQSDVKKIQEEIDIHYIKEDSEYPLFKWKRSDDLC